MKKLIGLLFDSSAFRIAYIVCLYFTMISYVAYGAYVMMGIMGLWGFVLAIRNAFKNKIYYNMRYGLWLFAFLISTTISIVLHCSTNLLLNLLMQIHVVVCFVMFYGMHTEKDFDFKKELFVIARFLVYATAIIGLIGFLFLCFGIYFEFGGFKFIIFDNRFTGLYANPNLLGFVSVVTLVLSHMLTKTEFTSAFLPKRMKKRFLIPSVCINVMSLFLCDSNASLVLFCAYVVFICAVGLFKKSEIRHTKKQVRLKIFSNIFVVLATFAALFGLRMFAQFISSTIVNATTSVIPSNVGIFHSVDEITFTHKNTGLDSGRFKLLRQGLDLFTNNPIFGIGKGNLYEYGERYLSNGFEFTDSYGDYLSAVSTDLHNGYLTILVCAGIVGFSLFAIFGIKFAKHFIFAMFADKKDIQSDVLPCIFAFLCAYLIYSLFEKTILYDFSFMVVFFWLMLGYASCYLLRYEPSHSPEYNRVLRKLHKE